MAEGIKTQKHKQKNQLLVKYSKKHHKQNQKKGRGERLMSDMSTDMGSILEEEVVIVGAGIAGLATALALKRVGIKALVLEKADALRTTGAALNLFPNAWIALDSLGVSHKLKPLYPHLTTGSVTNIPTGSVKQISLTGFFS